jgi:transposase
MLTRLKLSPEELNKLNYERYHYPCALVQKRLHAVYIKATTNFSNEVVAIIVSSHRNKIAQWIKDYQSGGIEQLKKLGYDKNQSELEQHSDSITDFFSRHPPRSIAEASLKIEEITSIKRGKTQVAAFLKRHKFRFIKTGHIPAKADTQKQQDWVEQTLKPVIEAAQKGEMHLLFVDAAHFILQPFLCCLWCITRVFIKASAGRNRINVLGAVNAITKEVNVYTNTTYICANTIITFFMQLREKYNDRKPIAIVLDNARYQHCFIVKTMAKGLGIHLLFLPSYSPNLNIIERLWKFTKKEILYAKYYDAPQKFHAAIDNFFKIINQKHNIELQKLLTLKFQFFDKSIAPFHAE